MDEQEKQIQDIILALNKLEMAFERHEEAMQSLTQSQAKIAASMEQLVEMQKNHDVLKVECHSRIDGVDAAAKRAHTRIDKIDSTQTWFTRIVFGVIILAVLANIGLHK